MSFRFRRSIKVAPGLRLNVGKRGMSMSMGVRGASVTVGSSGSYANVGLPGTGFSYREKLDKKGPAPRGRVAQIGPQPQYQAVNLDAGVMVEDDGTVWLKDNNTGERLSEHVEREAKKQLADSIREKLQAGCEHWNSGIDQLLNVHLTTPRPDLQIKFTPASFPIPMPQPPVEKKSVFWGWLFRSYRDKIENQNEAARQAYQQSIQTWQNGKSRFDATQNARRRFIEHDRLVNPDAMQEYLHEAFSALQWPRETNISFQVQDDGKAVLLDVDLPEIEEMPSQQASVAARDLRILIKDRSDTQRRREYAAHIHGVIFRIIGDVFALLPSVEEVVCSGYSQRPAKATGRIVDEYLLSVRAFRNQWKSIDFGHLELVDPVVSLAAFQMRRKMTATGVFSPIEPFQEHDL